MEYFIEVTSKKTGKTLKSSPMESEEQARDAARKWRRRGLKGVAVVIKYPKIELRAAV